MNNEETKQAPRLHELKTLTEYFEPVKKREKRFELRKNDRDFKVGDFLLLQEFDGKKTTGRYAIVKVSGILENVYQFGLRQGYVVLSIKFREELNEAEQAELAQILNEIAG